MSATIIAATCLGIKEMGGIAGMTKVLRDYNAYGFKSKGDAAKAIADESKRMGGDGFFKHFSPSSDFGEKYYNKNYSDTRYSYTPSSEDNDASEERSPSVFGNKTRTGVLFGNKRRQNLFGN